jgi:O-antigen ligase
VLPAIWHRYIFLFGIIGLASGMLFGTVPTSIPQIIIAANWVLEKDFMLKWQRLKSNTFFWILISFFALHIVGTLYTSNIERGLDDLRNKAPLLVLPILFFSTAPLTQKELKLLFHFFFLSVVVSSIYCFLVYAGFTHKTIIDVRQASVFISHIRFSLFIAFTVIALVYFFFKEPKWYYKITYVSSLCWLLFFMYKLELATGFVCLVVVGVLLLIGIVLQKLNRRFIIIVFAGSLIVVGILIIKISASFNMFDTSTNNPNNKIYKTRFFN